MGPGSGVDRLSSCGSSDGSHLWDPLMHLLFYPVLHNWCNKGSGMYCVFVSCFTLNEIYYIYTNPPYIYLSLSLVSPSFFRTLFFHICEYFSKICYKNYWDVKVLTYRLVNSKPDAICLIFTVYAQIALLCPSFYLSFFNNLFYYIIFCSFLL